MMQIPYQAIIEARYMYDDLITSDHMILSPLYMVKKLACKYQLKRIASIVEKSKKENNEITNIDLTLFANFYLAIKDTISTESDTIGICVNYFNGRYSLVFSNAFKRIIIDIPEDKQNFFIVTVSDSTSNKYIRGEMEKFKSDSVECKLIHTIIINTIIKFLLY